MMSPIGSYGVIQFYLLETAPFEVLGQARRLTQAEWLDVSIDRTRPKIFFVYRSPVPSAMYETAFRRATLRVSQLWMNRADT